MYGLIKFEKIVFIFINDYKIPAYHFLFLIIYLRIRVPLFGMKIFGTKMVTSATVIIP